MELIKDRIERCGLFTSFPRMIPKWNQEKGYYSKTELDFLQNNILN